MRTRGLCAMHYHRWLKDGDVGSALPRKRPRTPMERARKWAEYLDATSPTLEYRELKGSPHDFYIEPLVLTIEVDSCDQCAEYAVLNGRGRCHGCGRRVGTCFENTREHDVMPRALGYIDPDEPDTDLNRPGLRKPLLPPLRPRRVSSEVNKEGGMAEARALEFRKRIGKLGGDTRARRLRATAEVPDDEIIEITLQISVPDQPTNTEVEG